LGPTLFITPFFPVFLSPSKNDRLMPIYLSLYVDSEVASSKSAFAMKFNTLLWLLTTGSQFAVGWWYRKQPVFFLPQGWLGPLGWWLALPFAPAGTSLFLISALQQPTSNPPTGPEQSCNMTFPCGPHTNSHQPCTYQLHSKPRMF